MTRIKVDKEQRRIAEYAAIGVKALYTAYQATVVDENAAAADVSDYVSKAYTASTASTRLDSQQRLISIIREYVETYGDWYADITIAQIGECLHWGLKDIEYFRDLARASDYVLKERRMRRALETALGAGSVELPLALGAVKKWRDAYKRGLFFYYIINWVYPDDFRRLFENA